MGAMPLWSVKDVLCPTVARTSAPRVASRAKTYSELLKRTLGGEKVTRGIAMWSNVCDQPDILSLLRLLTLST